VFETFCEIQPKDEWKEKLISCYENRRMRSAVIKEIDALDWQNVVKPSSQEERFEFQLHKSNSTENWLKSEELEERLRAHCSFIYVNAANMKKGRSTKEAIPRVRWWLTLILEQGEEEGDGFFLWKSWSSSTDSVTSYRSLTSFFS
jgi:hypothetical protein